MVSEPATTIRVLPDYIDPAPGVYAASSDTQAYAALLAMVAAGDAALLGERYDLDGKRSIAVHVGGGYRRNQASSETFDVSVRIGQNFYAGALRDYSHEWRERWWREAVQNAVDAGATEVRCTVEQQADGNWLVTCEDDGHGMDRDTIINKFLVLGGTTKEGTAEVSTGGFGKAKELLVLPWIYWEVHSRDTLIHGAGDQGKGQAAPMRPGTRLTVLMPADKHTESVHAMAFLKKSHLPAVRFYVNGELVAADLRVGRSVHSFGDKAELYYDEDNPNYSNYILVRVNGLFMFGQYLWSKRTRGTLVAELLPGEGKSASLRLLTANRDGIADEELKQGLEEFAGKVAIEAEEVLRKKEKRIREKFRGTGKFEINKDRVRAAALESLGTLEPLGEKHTRGDRELSSEQIGQLVHVFRSMQPVAPLEETVFTDERGERLAASGNLSFRVDPALVAEMLEGMPLAGPSQVEVAIRQLAWEPDFYVVNEIAGFHVPKKFFPQTMTATLRKLARYWAELCRFLLIQLECDEAFGVGFLFQEEHQAEHIVEHEEHWLMLNPFWNARPGNELLDIAGHADLAELFALALHECTHMAYRVSEHDLDFAKGLTSAIGKVYGKEKQIRAIKRIVLDQEKEVAERLRAGRRERTAWD